MAYTPKIKEVKVCECGCGRTFAGRAGRKYFSGTCRFKGFQQRKDELAKAS